MGGFGGDRSCVKDCSRRAASYEVRESKSGSGYFVLKGGNGHVIGHSEQYKSRRALANGMQSVRKNGPRAKTEDRT